MGGVVLTKIFLIGDTEYCAGLLPRGESTCVESEHECAEEARHHPQACYYDFLLCDSDTL